MSRQIQFRRGTADEHADFTGAIGEVTVDTTNKTLRVHDGQTPGGIPLARADAETDLDGADYVTEWQTPTAENNYTWYRKYKSGWVEQGGYLPKSTTVNVVITFLVPMQNNCYNWSLGVSHNVSSQPSYQAISCWGFSSTGMTLRSDVNYAKSWRVSGMAA